MTTSNLVNFKWLAQFPEMAEIARLYGPAPLSYRPAGLPALVLTILEQQIAVKAARTQFRNLAHALGGISGKRLADTGEQGLRRLGLTRQKARYLHNLGSEVVGRRFSITALQRMDDASAIETLIRLPGVGPWTASIYMMMALRRDDVWPRGDLALIRAANSLVDDKAAVAADDGARWAPFRTHAAFSLWHYYREAGDLAR